MLKPDRYTTLSIHTDDLPQKLTEARNLRLKFLVQPDCGSNERVYLYLFFDNAAMSNYLAENYGRFADEVRRLDAAYPDAATFGAAVRGLLVEE